MVDEQVRERTGRIGLLVIAAYIALLVTLALVMGSCDDGWELTR